MTLLLIGFFLSIWSFRKTAVQFVKENFIIVVLITCALVIPFSLPFLSVSLCTQEANQGCGQVLHCEVKGENACEALGFGAQYLYI